MTQYYGGGRDYKVDLGDKGLFQGTVSNAIVFLPREEDKVLAKIRAQHDKQYGIDDQALMSVHPYWNFPITMGKVKFEQPVQTAIEEIS